ncbi:hypothetical protein IV102_36100 [bacterium]|nr:hypothetical protein [bacterium]
MKPYSPKPAVRPPQQKPPQPEQPQPGPVRHGIETAAGWMGAGVGALTHAPMGALDGLVDGVTGKYDSTNYHILSAFSSLSAGAGIGAAMAGPGGLLVGGAAGLIGSLATGMVAASSDADEAWLKGVDKSVQTALADNTQGTPIKLAIQNATEGTMVGLVAGSREGAKIGEQVGKGMASAVLDVAAGIGEGVWEFLRS